MNTDIRLHIEFWDHAKVKAMIRALGPWGPICMQKLWCYAAKHRVNGILRDMDAEQIEIAAGWPDDRPGEFFKYLTTHRWLDKTRTRGVWQIHEWVKYNSWAADAEARSIEGKKGAHVVYHVKRGVSKPESCEFCRDAMGTPRPPLADSNAPAPAPAPTPSPSPAPIAEIPPCSPPKGGRGRSRRRAETFGSDPRIEYERQRRIADAWIADHGIPATPDDRTEMYERTGIDWVPFTELEAETNPLASLQRQREAV